MLRNLKNLSKDTLTYGMSNALSQVIGLLLLPVYTRYLSPSDYGVTAMLSLLTQVFVPIARLGITNAIFRRYNLETDSKAKERVLSTGLVSVLLSGTLLIIVCLLFSSPITFALFSSSEYLDLVQITIISAGLSVFTDAPSVTLRANRKVGLVSILNLTRITIAILFNIYFVVVLQIGVKGVVIGTLIAEIICFILSLYLTRKSWRLEFDWAAWKPMAKYGIPFIPHHLQAVGLSILSQYFVAHMIGLTEAGLYSLATRISAPLGMLCNAIQQAWVPLKFQIHAQEKQAAEIFRSITIYYFALTCFFWLACSLFGPDVLVLMTTSEFHAASPLIPLVGFIPLAQGTYWMVGTGFEMSDSTNQLPLISFVGLITVTALGLTLTPVWGSYGAAMTSIIGWLVMAVMIFYFAQKRFPVKQAWTLIFSFVLIAALLIASQTLVQNFPLWARLAYKCFLCGIYLAVIFLALFLSESERDRALKIWARFKRYT